MGTFTVALDGNPRFIDFGNAEVTDEGTVSDSEAQAETARLLELFKC